jgi:hypothetical protein
VSGDDSFELTVPTGYKIVVYEPGTIKEFTASDKARVIRIEI